MNATPPVRHQSHIYKGDLYRSTPMYLKRMKEYATHQRKRCVCHNISLETPQQRSSAQDCVRNPDTTQRALSPAIRLDTLARSRIHVSTDTCAPGPRLTNRFLSGTGKNVFRTKRRNALFLSGWV